MKYRAKTATLVRAEPSENAVDTGSIERNIEFEGAPNPQGTWIHAERPVVGWVDKDDCEEIAGEREPVQRDGFVQRCVIAEWTFNASEGISPWVVVADYLIARAIIETNIENPGPADGSDAVGPLRISSAEWNDFLQNGGVLAAGYLPAHRDHPIRQVDGAAFRMHRDAKRLSELRVAAGKTPANDPFVPTLLDVFLAYLADSPEAALAILDAHARDPNMPVDRVLEPPLATAALLDVRERFFKAAGTPKSLRAVVAGTRAILDAALEQAAREIQQHMPEALPFVSEDGATPWLDVAEAAKSAGVDERDPRFKSTILDYFDATDFRPRPTSVTTPWCGAFADHCMKASGNRTAAASIPKGAAAAANWKAWGTGLPWPSPSLPEGAVVVLSPNHVGFFLEFEGDRVFLLGGNQSDRVDRTPFPRSQIVAVRWLNLAPAQSAAGAPPDAGATVGTLSTEQWATYLNRLGEMESGNNYGVVNRLGYCGRWQFGAGALVDAGYVRPGTTNRNLLSPAAWTGKDGVNSRADWLARPDAQDAAMLTYTRAHYNSLLEHGELLPTSSPARIVGLLAAAHLMGLGGARHLVNGTVTQDANGTTTLKYYQQLSVALGGTGRLEA
jgi:uncharacterized protein (TIGR02594 family)